MLKNYFLAGILLLTLFPATAQSRKSVPKPAAINYKEIKELYYYSEFEQVTTKLEDCLEKGLLKYKEDSVFAFKYLGVIYASDPDFQTKGEWYLSILVSLNPDVEMDEMHLSSDLEALFERVKIRYYKKNGQEPPSQNTQPNPNQSASSADSEQKKRWQWWALGGGAAVLALGAIAIVRSSSGEEGVVSEMEISVEVK